MTKLTILEAKTLAEEILINAEKERRVMEKKCPYCGSEFFESYVDLEGISTDEYACGTWIDNRNCTRSSQCYDAQLTQQAELFKKAVEVVKLYHEAIPSPETQALIPALEKALEKAK